MEASSSRSRVRPIVVDFLATLFLTFCIGVAAAVVLGACVMLMAAEARAKAIELALTHQLVTKYASFIAIDRMPARAALGPSPRPKPEKID